MQSTLAAFISKAKSVWLPISFAFSTQYHYRKDKKKEKDPFPSVKI